MAVVADKSRFYLERSVPDLLELERKEILTRSEISIVVRKRSDFEHKVNARGCSTKDYKRYIQFETSLDALCQCRRKRSGIKLRNRAGQHQIDALLKRATGKFPGDMELWMMLLRHVRKQRAHKRVSEVLTQMLRLHPTRADLWIYAAEYAVQDQGDMTEARDYFQRGLRFCEKDSQLWIQYFRFELVIITRLLRRRQILGLDHSDHAAKDSPDYLDLSRPQRDGPSLVHLELDSTKSKSQDHQVDTNQPNLNPIFSGRIPLAIFDEAVKILPDTLQSASEMFDVVAEFQYLSCAPGLAAHIVAFLESSAPRSPSTLLRSIQAPSIGVDHVSGEFPSAMVDALSRIDPAFDSLTDDQDAARLCISMIDWLVTICNRANLSPNIDKALKLTANRILSRYAPTLTLARPGEKERLEECLAQRTEELDSAPVDQGKE